MMERVLYADGIDHSLLEAMPTPQLRRLQESAETLIMEAEQQLSTETAQNLGDLGVAILRILNERKAE